MDLPARIAAAGPNTLVLAELQDVFASVSPQTVDFLTKAILALSINPDAVPELIEKHGVDTIVPIITSALRFKDAKPVLVFNQHVSPALPRALNPDGTRSGHARIPEDDDSSDDEDMIDIPVCDE